MIVPVYQSVFLYWSVIMYDFTGLTHSQFNHIWFELSCLECNSFIWLVDCKFSARVEYMFNSTWKIWKRIWSLGSKAQGQKFLSCALFLFNRYSFSHVPSKLIFFVFIHDFTSYINYFFSVLSLVHTLHIFINSFPLWYMHLHAFFSFSSIRSSALW